MISRIKLLIRRLVCKHNVRHPEDRIQIRRFALVGMENGVYIYLEKASAAGRYS